jgi:hypothetical protein
MMLQAAELQVAAPLVIAHSNGKKQTTDDVSATAA